MPKGCCDGDTCSCLIQGGTGITVTGAGTPTSPYIVEAQLPDFSASLQVRDSLTVNLSLFGSGVPSDPFVLQASSSLRLVDLTDIDDPEGGPIAGDVPVWVGTGADAHFEFRPPPVAPAGSVNVANGLRGIGTVADPLEVSTSGIWGTGDLAGLGSDTTTGLEIYVDANGQLRAQPVTATSGSVSWGSITDKPTTFTPIAHKHPPADITDQINLSAGLINGKRVYIQTTTPPVGPAGTLWFSW